MLEQSFDIEITAFTQFSVVKHLVAMNSVLSLI